MTKIVTDRGQAFAAFLILCCFCELWARSEKRRGAAREILMAARCGEAIAVLVLAWRCRQSAAACELDAAAKEVIVKRFSERAYYVFSGALMILGSLVSENGGRQHPIVSQRMGPYGSPEFFGNFARMILGDQHWEPIHAQILAGPVLWILGAVAISTLVRSTGGRRWALLAVAAMAMGATLWVVTYIFDGFISLQTAPYVLHGNPALLPAFRSTFSLGQWVAIRTSFVAWLLIAFGTGCMSAGLATLIRKSVGLGRVLVITMTGLGVLLVGWSFAAAVSGAYLPGPMVSNWYLPSLIGTQWWFILGGLLVIYVAVIRPHALQGRLAEPEPEPEPAPAPAAAA